MEEPDLRHENTGAEPKAKTFSRCQWWLNWIMVILIQAIISITYGVVMPSLHQFVTNEAKDDDGESLLDDVERNFSVNGSDAIPQTPNSLLLIWPGLAQSEFIYSWVVTSYSIGELLGAFLGGLLTSLISYRFNIFFLNVILIVGASVYALTVHASMILIARFLMGVHCGYGLVLLTSYIGVTTDQLEAEKLARAKESENDDHNTSKSEPSKSSKCFKKQHKNTTLKDWIFGIYSLVLCISYPFTLGVCAIMSSFSHLNPFHWPGWFVVAVTMTYLFLFVLLFRETTPFFSRPIAKKKEPISNKKLRKTCPSVKRMVMYSILTVASYMAASICTPRDVLMNPLLGDQFGFRISDMSYFMLAIMFIRTLSLLFQLVVKFFSVPNRFILIVVFIVAILGCLLLSDWQAIGYDSCYLNDSKLISAGVYSSNSTETTSLSQYNTSHLEQLCLALSNHTSEDHHQQGQQLLCYWNPQSRITGHFCAECHPVCRSFQKSLNFVQFFIGLSLVSCAIPLAQVFVSVVTSDYTPVEYQGVLMGCIFTAAGLARFVTPMLVDWTYEATDKHTYVPMSLMNFGLLTIVIILLIAYKQLAPKTERQTSKKNGNYAVLVSDLSGETDKNCDKDGCTTSHDHELFINSNTTHGRCHNDITTTSDTCTSTQDHEEVELSEIMNSTHNNHISSESNESGYENKPFFEDDNVETITFTPATKVVGGPVTFCDSFEAGDCQIECERDGVTPGEDDVDEEWIDTDVEASML